MGYYQSNPACRCGRCATRGVTGPAVLVTLGLLFLADNMSGYPFHRTWPVLLIVIGAIKVARYVIPDDHINPGPYPAYGGAYPPPYGQPQYTPGVPFAGTQPAAPAQPPATEPAAGAANGNSGGDGEVHHG